MTIQNITLKHTISPVGIICTTPISCSARMLTCDCLVFSDAYYGNNLKIRDTLNNLILKSPQTWQTSVGLPFVRIEGTVVEWDEIRFDVRLLQRVPYEGKHPAPYFFVPFCPRD